MWSNRWKIPRHKSYTVSWAKKFTFEDLRWFIWVNFDRIKLLFSPLHVNCREKMQSRKIFWIKRHQHEGGGHLPFTAGIFRLVWLSSVRKQNTQQSIRNFCWQSEEQQDQKWKKCFDLIVKERKYFSLKKLSNSEPKSAAVMQEKTHHFCFD